MPANKYNQNSTVLETVLEEIARRSGRTSGFVQRRSKMTGERFAQMMVLGCLEKPAASLNDFAQVSSDLAVNITAAGINQRMNGEAVEMMKELLGETIRHCQVKRRGPQDVLKRFTAVRILDSTHVSLPDGLQELFAGKGGDGPEAGAKIQLSYEYLQGEITAIELVDGRAPDQRCELHTQFATVGSLHLFDLGYFKQEHFARLDAQGAYFVSRYQSQTALYWRADDAVGFDVVAFVQSIDGDRCETSVYLGRKTRLSVRVLFQRLPPDVVEERRRKARVKMRREGKTPSKRYLQLLEWATFITNVPTQWLSFEQVLLVYRIRWQIEIIFKLWKSDAHLDKIGSWRTNRVLCQLYARLTALVLFHWLVAPHRFHGGTELSLVKAFRVMQRYIPRLADAIAQGWCYVTDVLDKICTDFLRFARKDKRKKSPSTYQHLLCAGA